MAGADIRISLTPIFEAFSVAATVTRPAPDDTPIVTEGVWLPEQTSELLGGTEMRRQDMRRIFCLDRSIGAVPRGTRIAASEELGGTVKTWVVEGPDREEHDLLRVVVLPLAAD